MQETQETWVRSLGQEESLKESVATHSSILAWGIPWTEETGGLLCIGMQRVIHDWSEWTHMQEKGYPNFREIYFSLLSIWLTMALGIISTQLWKEVRNRTSVQSDNITKGLLSLSTAKHLGTEAGWPVANTRCCSRSCASQHPQKIAR